MNGKQYCVVAKAREMVSRKVYRRIKMRDHHSEKQGIGHLT